MSIEDRIAAMVQQTKQRIADNGHTYVGVFDNTGAQPGFVYSIGLTQRGWPEVLLIGNINPRMVEILLNDVIGTWEEKGAPVFGKIPDMLVFPDGSSRALHVQEVDPVQGISLYACQVPKYCDGPYRVAQVMWPDANGVYPTEPGYSTAPAMVQPVLPTI